MRRFGSAIGRVFHSRAGGTLACVLLASVVGGVALANPGAFGGGGPGRARVEATRTGSDAAGEDGRRNETLGGSGGAHSVAECRLLVTHVSDELARGDASGLRRAVDRVVGSCRRHEDAPGLSRALDRLLLKLGERVEDGPILGGKGGSNGNEAKNEDKAQNETKAKNEDKAKNETRTQNETKTQNESKAQNDGKAQDKAHNEDP